MIVKVSHASQDDDAAPLIDHIELMIPLRRSRCQDQEFTSSTCSTELGKRRDHLPTIIVDDLGTIGTTPKEPVGNR